MRAVIDLKSDDTSYRVLAWSFNRASVVLPHDPVIKAALGAIRARDWNRVLGHAETLETQLYSSVLDQYVKSQLVALVKKFPWTPREAPGFDPEAAAWKKFLAAEHRCKRVNQRQRLLRYGVGFPYGDILSSMRVYIRHVLGRTPDYRQVYRLCDFGPGANVGVTGDLTSFARKILAEEWTVSPLALSYCTQALWENTQIAALVLERGPGRLVCFDREEFAAKVRSRVRLVSHNNVSFVPKSYKTHRSIATEPLLNGFLQKGIDQYMRYRLKRFANIDLKDQSLNQAMARLGSFEGFDPFVTIDLSAASDSISDAICKTLLPSEWYEFLNSARSHQYSYQGSVRTYEKFVSMGNGFCFPLQTLIFAAASWAVTQECGAPAHFRVYGDDIIVRQSEALRLLEVLRYLGFRANLDKTCLTGQFRESCGADWHSGQDIRPVYMDFRLTSNIDLYKFHNSTLRSPIVSWFFEPLREKLRAWCPPSHRFVRPVHGSPESAFTVGLDEAMSSKFVSWNRVLQTWKWTEVKTTSVRDHLYPFTWICNELEYLSVLRGSDTSCPAAVRRKTKAAIRRVSGSGLPGHLTWVGADPFRTREGAEE